MLGGRKGKEAERKQEGGGKQKKEGRGKTQTTATGFSV